MQNQSSVLKLKTSRFGGVPLRARSTFRLEHIAAKVMKSGAAKVVLLLAKLLEGGKFHCRIDPGSIWRFIFVFPWLS
jgi:hypothetical protein